jgi:glutathione S-transferase
MTPLFLKLIIDRLESSRVPIFLRPVIRSIAERMRQTLVKPRLEDILDFMEAELARNVWFAGDRFTAADIQMSFPVQAALARSGSVKARPHLKSFAERIESRPSYKRALVRGGKFEILR